MGAVDEGIAVATGRPVSQLANARIAGRGVGGDDDGGGPLVAHLDAEPEVAPCRLRGAAHLVDVRERRRIRAQLVDERVDRPQVALDFDDDVSCPVSHEPHEGVPGGQLVDERTESDALDDPGHGDGAPNEVPRFLTHPTPPNRFGREAPRA